MPSYSSLVGYYLDISYNYSEILGLKQISNLSDQI